MTFHGQPIRSSCRTSVAVLAILFSGVASVAAFAVSSPAAKSPDLKHQVEALEEQWRVAQLAGDIATMDKMLSDDYIGISITGEVDTKAQQLRRVADRRMMLTRIELSDMKVKLVGAVAIVTSRAQVEGSNDGISVRGMYRYTRVYHRLSTGQWKITSFEATREHRSHRQIEGEAADGSGGRPARSE
jgi:ketosteroid isomerase-like protein